MSQARDLNIRSVLAGMPAYTVNLHQHEMVTDEVARAIFTTTGHPNPLQLLAGAAACMQELALPIRNSFRRLTDHSVVGYLSAHRAVRQYNDKDATVTAKYREVASNMLMDKEDESTWEMKAGASGKYLARTGTEDLSELASRVQRTRSGAPKLAMLATASVPAHRFVAFLDVKEQEVDYGHCVGHHTNGDLVVVAYSTQEPLYVPAQLVINEQNMTKQDNEAFGRELAGDADLNTCIEYYRKAYPYAPDYVQMIIEQFRQMTAG